MRLLNLKFNPNQPNGWESPLLEFGYRTTSLFAKNGSGKTPIVQGIAFSLGSEVKFREDIRAHCHSVSLGVLIAGKDVRIEREIDDGTFHVVIEGGRSRTFYNEADFSAAMFQELGFDVPLLVSTAQKSTAPYISTVLPIFFMRQDGGYLSAYTPPRGALFIQDQFVEMLRFVFGYPPKRSYSVKRFELQEKAKLDHLQRKIVHQQQLIAQLEKDTDESPLNEQVLRARSSEITLKMEELRFAGSKKDAAMDALNDLLADKDKLIQKLRRERNSLQTRINGIDEIRSEIEGEIKTLSLNEEARQAFLRFDDICNNPGCGLFETTNESYGKNLLYLKDQIKDLESNVDRAEIQVGLLDESVVREENARTELRVKIDSLSTKEESTAIVTATQNLTRELIDVERILLHIERLREERRKYIQLDEERFKVQDAIAAIGRSGRADLGFNQLKASLEQLTSKWMSILKTKNVSREVNIEPDFKYRFGSEPLDIFTGSGKARLVLAIHGAIFEKYLEKSDRPFRFLMLDTPKQHELDSADLATYLAALEQLCVSHNAQIVVSSTEYRHPIGPNDREWLPAYEFPDRPMYLGPVS